ncbi:MAG TPA: DNA polymerase Y family protein [Burkholderiaceae bacterium]|nr:DNA polymerase Y family protein [Burkholderiaceae bacterium]
MLWLALLLPALPLQLAERALPCVGPLAIVEGPPQRLAVVHCNATARAAGVVPGMKLAAAQALARGLIALERNAERERDALAELAGWAYQFSSHVVLQPDGLLLEAGGSARLFGGAARLNRTIADGLEALGYRAVSACAAAPRTARMLALAHSQGLPCPAAALRTPDRADEGEWAAAQPTRTPESLPIAALEWDETTNETLRALGLATIGDLLALPRDAFARRFGAGRLADLDRALGTRSDPQPLYEPPARFHAQIELPADLAETAQLMFPARRLLASLEGFLCGRNAGSTLMRFTAAHSARRGVAVPPTTFTLALAAPERDAARLAALLEERLARVRLPAPAITLALTVDRLQPFAALNASLLPQTADATRGVDWLQLAETLHARLGSERVFQLQAVDDHRPERAWRAVPLAVDEARAGPPPLPAAPRPLLLLSDPQPLPARNDQPLYRDPLTLVAGPERIECGWWDLGGPATGSPARAVHRDYFVARNGRGQWLWIYRELAAPRGWFLHGLFA